MTSTKTWGGLFDPYWGVRSKMAALPLPAAILDDLICGTENEVIQDGRRKRKGRHLAPHSSMGVEKAALYYSCIQKHINTALINLTWDICNIYLFINTYINKQTQWYAGIYHIVVNPDSLSVLCVHSALKDRWEVKHIDGLVQNCNALAMEIRQSCTKSPISTNLMSTNSIIIVSVDGFPPA